MIDEILERGCKDIVIQVMDNGTQTSALQIIRDEVAAMKEEIVKHIALSRSNNTGDYEKLVGILSQL